MSTVEFILAVAFAYIALGVVWGVYFVIKGISRVDAVTADRAKAGWGFRLIILPGVIGLWPLTLWMWLRAARSLDGAHA